VRKPQLIVAVWPAALAAAFNFTYAHAVGLVNVLSFSVMEASAAVWSVKSSGRIFTTS